MHEKEEWEYVDGMVSVLEYLSIFCLIRPERIVVHMILSYPNLEEIKFCPWAYKC